MPSDKEDGILFAAQCTCWHDRHVPAVRLSQLYSAWQLCCDTFALSRAYIVVMFCIVVLLHDIVTRRSVTGYMSHVAVSRSDVELCSSLVCSPNDVIVACVRGARRSSKWHASYLSFSSVRWTFVVDTVVREHRVGHIFNATSCVQLLWADVCV